MNRIVVAFVLSLSIALASLISGTSISSAAGPLETTGNVRWVVYASRQNIDEAIGLARRFQTDQTPMKVLSTSNGWYAVAAGPVTVPDPVAFKKKLAESWYAPKDAFLSKGPTFLEKVWESPRSPVLAQASSEDQQPHSASAGGLEVRIESRNAVRVRSGGNDVATVTFDDNDNEPPTSASAVIARLDPASPFPQVVASHFTGGAHCCTDMRILTFTGDRWQVVKLGQYDAGGPTVTDLNGDGSSELVGSDNSFKYAFASYAESYSPPMFLRLTGARVENVTRAAEFQRPIRQILLAVEGTIDADYWKDNGFLGGWVAHKSLLGEGADAWRRMLELYNRNSDWDLTVCMVATQGADPCPDNAKRNRDFPTALREHLAKGGYDLTGIGNAPAAVRPSFDCNKARTASELEICRTADLAELDNILAAGYAFIKTTRGRPAADAIGIPYWKMIAKSLAIMTP